MATRNNTTFDIRVGDALSQSENVRAALSMIRDRLDQIEDESLSSELYVLSNAANFELGRMVEILNDDQLQPSQSEKGGQQS